MDRPIDRHTDGWTDGWKDRWTDRKRKDWLTDWHLNRPTDGQTDRQKQTEGQTDGQTKDWPDWLTDRLMDRQCCQCVRKFWLCPEIWQNASNAQKMLRKFGPSQKMQLVTLRRKPTQLCKHYAIPVLPLWSAFAEKVRILTFCPKLVRKRSAFTQQSLLFTFPLQIDLYWIKSLL